MQVVRLLFLSMLIFGCQNQSKLNKADYLTAFKSASFSYSSVQEVNDVEFKVKILPVEYLVLKRFPKINLDTLDSFIKKNKYDQGLNLKLIISTPKNTSGIRYGTTEIDELRSKIKKAAIDLEQQVKIIDKNVVYDCKVLKYERRYDYSNELVFNLDFNLPMSDISKGATLEFEDLLFGKGKIKLNLYKEKQMLPILNY